MAKGEKFHQMIDRVAKKRGAPMAVKQAHAAFKKLHGMPLASDILKRAEGQMNSADIPRE